MTADLKKNVPFSDGQIIVGFLDQQRHQQCPNNVVGLGDVPL